MEKQRVEEGGGVRQQSGERKSNGGQSAEGSRLLHDLKVCTRAARGRGLEVRVREPPPCGTMSHQGRG